MKKLWKALLMVHRCHPLSFWLRVVYVVLQSVLPLVNLWLLKLLIDAVSMSVGGQMPIEESMGYLLAMCGVFLLNRIVTALNGINNDVLGQRLIDYVSDLMQRQAARLDMQYYDNPAFHDTMHRAQQEASFRPLRILTSFMSLGGSLISIVGVVALLAAASWWVIVVMIVAVLPGFAVRLYKARQIYRFRRNNTQLYRRTAYYSALLMRREYAKEMKAFRLAPLFRERFVDVRKQLVGRLLSISRRLGAMDVLCGVVEAAAMFGVVGLLVSQAYGGAITLGTFVMLFEAFRRGQGYLSSLVEAIASLYDNRLFVGNLFEFLELRPTLVAPEKPLPVPEEVSEVEFRDITFRYPDMDRDVLTHFSLVCRRGELMRIDGRNGYGKSTLVKLLLRLYDPQGGAVLINGTDIRRFDPDALRRRVGVLFQDFVQYNCTAAENVSFGKVEGEADVAKALSMAGADKVTQRLPYGPDTMLGRIFDGGSDLSMGQWQRIALARALSSDAPIMIFDEPTAWLDREARQNFAQMVGRLQHDHLVIVITHSQDFE